MFINLRKSIPSSHHVLLDNLEQIVKALKDNSKDSSILDLSGQGVQLLNEYITFAIAVYMAKFLQLYETLCESLESDKILIYAQVGRSIIENAASLRYYSRLPEIEYLRTINKNQLTKDNYDNALLAIDKMVRGSRFTWQAFLEGRFDELGKNLEYEELNQVNIKTCLNHWYKQSPNLESLYDLFCDVVHPNLGSNMTVIKIWEGKLSACGELGENNMAFFIAPSLAGIVGIYKEIQKIFLNLEKCVIT